MNIVRTPQYGRGGSMRQALANYLGRKYNLGGNVDLGDGNPEKKPLPERIYAMEGYNNVANEQGIIPGDQGLYLVIPGENGGRALTLSQAKEEFGFDESLPMLRAMGIKATKTGMKDGKPTFYVDEIKDPRYRQRLLAGMGAQEGEGYSFLQDRLGIGRVDYDRERDLPNIINASGGLGGY